jgi:hypothetical protein
MMMSSSSGAAQASTAMRRAVRGMLLSAGGRDVFFEKRNDVLSLLPFCQ